MRDHTVAEVAALAGARLVEADRADRSAGPGVTNDSRACLPGSVYAALPGERVDGHDFLEAAATAGAVAALCLRPTQANLAHLVVDDVQAALSFLARGLVAEAKADGLTCVGITGSSGKTSTKDLVAQVLEAAGPTVSPPGSLNNEIGVPLTACRIDLETRFLVAEMGARGLGHVAWLCRVVPPDIGVVINVGHAHVGEFGSVETIARAKGELVEALPASGWAVLNAADDLVAAMASRTRARIASFAPGRAPEFGDLRVWAEQYSPDGLQRFAFTLRVSGVISGSETVSLRVPGLHQLHNALAAAAVGLVAGLDLAVVAAALSRAEARSRWRMEVTERPDGIVVVNDSYNANPDSMRAALSTSAELRRDGGKVVALLGDMLELGEYAAREHLDLGRTAAALGYDLVVAVGGFAAQVVEGAREGGAESIAAADKDEAFRRVYDRLVPGDVVLIKASRGLALDTVAQRLIDAAPKGEARP